MKRLAHLSLTLALAATSATLARADFAGEFAITDGIAEPGTYGLDVTGSVLGSLNNWNYQFYVSIPDQGSGSVFIRTQNTSNVPPSISLETTLIAVDNSAATAQVATQLTLAHTMQATGLLEFSYSYTTIDSSLFIIDYFNVYIGFNPTPVISISGTSNGFVNQSLNVITGDLIRFEILANAIQVDGMSTLESTQAILTLEDIRITAIPEPATTSLLLGCFAIGGVALRRRR